VVSASSAGGGAAGSHRSRPTMANPAPMTSVAAPSAKAARHGRAGRSCGHHPVGFAIGDEPGCHGHGRLLLCPHRSGGIFPHADRLGGMDHGKDGSDIGELSLELVAIADEDDVDPPGNGVDRTEHRLLWSMVPAHGVERYASHDGLRTE